MIKYKKTINIEREYQKILISYVRELKQASKEIIDNLVNTIDYYQYIDGTRKDSFEGEIVNGFQNLKRVFAGVLFPERKLFELSAKVQKVDEDYFKSLVKSLI